jgi:hypothetical protein
MNSLSCLEIYLRINNNIDFTKKMTFSSYHNNEMFTQQQQQLPIEIIFHIIEYACYELPTLIQLSNTNHAIRKFIYSSKPYESLYQELQQQSPQSIPKSKYSYLLLQKRQDTSNCFFHQAFKTEFPEAYNRFRTNRYHMLNGQVDVLTVDQWIVLFKLYYGMMKPNFNTCRAGYFNIDNEEAKKIYEIHRQNSHDISLMVVDGRSFSYGSDYRIIQLACTSSLTFESYHVLADNVACRIQYRTTTGPNIRVDGLLMSCDVKVSRTDYDSSSVHVSSALSEGFLKAGIKNTSPTLVLCYNLGNFSDTREQDMVYSAYNQMKRKVEGQNTQFEVVRLESQMDYRSIRSRLASFAVKVVAQRPRSAFCSVL